jgi:TolB protein
MLSVKGFAPASSHRGFSFLFCGLLRLFLLGCCVPAHAAREPVLKQIDLPHSYYFREMYLPQLTTGPSGVDFSPDGREVIYSMAGSLWRQKLGDGVAVELTHGPGYDFQPEWSPDGRSVVFARHHRNAIELQRLDLTTLDVRPLTQGGAVNVEPRYSPDGKRLAYVSTRGASNTGGGHFNLFVADIDEKGLAAARTVVAPRESAIARYYYSTHDHAINPSWTPDGERLVFVSNREIAYGTGDLCSVALAGTGEPTCFVREETSWRANPQVAPDGRRVLYSSYHGRQHHQLWVTTLAGAAPLPLTFGEFDVTHARWSPDGRRIAYLSNEGGNVSLWVQDVVGGKRSEVAPRERRYRRAMHELALTITDASGKPVAARVSVVAADGRHYFPADAWAHADDGFDAAHQGSETLYFHCYENKGERRSACSLRVPSGDVQITVWRGHEHRPVEQVVRVQGATAAHVMLQPLLMPDWAPHARTADMHVHMNYGGHYRHTIDSLIEQARAEDLDVVYNTIVNKEQRVPDIREFSKRPTRRDGVTIYQAQEYHTSFWGHLGLLHLDEHLLLPDFSAYQHSALTSPYPHNGLIADLAHAQNALVGYVHPYDWPIAPEKEKSLTHAFPADVALGKTDYIEVVGFSDHKATADAWHRLLNLGFRIPAGAGTDAMANYASLRGPVGLNRVYLQTEDDSADALRRAVKQGRTVASNGPQLALQLVGGEGEAVFDVGDVVPLKPGEHRLRYRAALRSPVPVDRLEVVHDGRVVATHRFGKDRTTADMNGEFVVRKSGWLLVRAWSESAHRHVFDLYAYATTSPIYLEVEGAPARSPEDAAYFVRWMDRLLAAAEARTDYNDERERRDTLDYLRAAREVFAKRSNEPQKTAKKATN